jgi:hypothetical protein
MTLTKKQIKECAEVRKKFYSIGMNMSDYSDIDMIEYFNYRDTISTAGIKAEEACKNLRDFVKVLSKKGLV